ncbi:class I SAM-dependent methyltransferase [Neorhizobium sp. BETTINA12A]|uniref:class I SAM-dependent methyltransferase n=1 Tax=Neorhizobium sp. BETTINA12A TaxID=2908924 RepID=UPI001FF1977C|nr:class I SAM-dependent methyltransferase [Neorhizobium sp. BETTINA12A]MCJ9751170.1 class I SAM-dependent methyltransferase [Neorhizobium sp. BETTINA12A]
MSRARTTSTGHEASDASWLDLHYRSSRAEYEHALSSVGIKTGWSVLDAGCGGGDFLPLLAEFVGTEGAITALDLAPENIARVETLAREGRLPSGIVTKVGSLLDLPFPDAAFDCVWIANVAQYLTPAEFETAVAEARRVLKPGGLLAIKEFDSHILQVQPMDSGAFSRFMNIRLATFATKGVLGTGSGTGIASRLRATGLTDITARGFLVERWADCGADTKAYVRNLLSYFATVAPQYPLPSEDLATWQGVAANPERLLDDPGFCYREFFVLTLATMPG